MAARSSVKKVTKADTATPMTEVDTIETTYADNCGDATKVSSIAQQAHGLNVVAVEDAVGVNQKSGAFKVRKVIDPHATVIVRNGFHGKLIYKSRRTGESYVWHEFGDEQEMEIQELRNAKGANKAFFVENWFLFDDPEVIDYLGVNVYYKNALTYEEFDELFDMNVDDMVERVSKLSGGQKKSIAYRAVQMIESDMIDSRSKIAALEKALGMKLVE